MKHRINLDFQLLYQSVVLSVFGVGALFGGAYLTYLLLALVFSSWAVFASLFVLVVSLGVLLLYDGEAFQWDRNPRIAIKRTQIGSGDEDE